MTILSARVVKRPRKQRRCEDCGYMLPAGEPQLKLYGFAHCGDKPHNLHLHLNCIDHTVSRKIERAIEQYQAGTEPARAA